VTHLLAVLALDLRVVPRLRAFLGEVTGLLAVAADNRVGVARLVTLPSHMVGGSAVATSTSGNVGALELLARSVCIQP